MSDYVDTARSWLKESFDEQTRNEVQAMLEGDPKILEDAFYRTLEFGTGGLRGIMGAGTNRMNRYTVGMATQGLANYLNRCFKGEKISVVVSYDCRNNSRQFAEITAKVLMANDIQVYLFDGIRPTPELSFAIRHLKCNSGVMVTASHNPKEYNGYKVFWADGGQIVAPHDVNIVDEVNRITDPSQVRVDEEAKPVMIGADVDEAYLGSVLTSLVSPESIARHSDLKIAYTPLHGTGVKLVPEALKRIGFRSVYRVAEQEVNDGNFPTVVSPNPEEPTAMKMVMELADKVGAEIALGTDPDADRVGCAVRGRDGTLVLLNGNQTACLITNYMLTRWAEEGRLNGGQYVIKTIVTSELMTAICNKYGVRIYDVLTGFKNIASVMHANEGKSYFICGGEESNGFNAGEFVRDKDSIITCSLLCECAAWCADRGKTLYDYLQDTYAEYGLYCEKGVSVTRKGKDGLAEIAAMMTDYRKNPPRELAGSKVIRVIDYTFPEKTGLPYSNVLQFFSEDGCKVTVRPSGTEPKIKYYFATHGENAEAKSEELFRQFRS